MPVEKPISNHACIRNSMKTTLGMKKFIIQDNSPHCSREHQLPCITFTSFFQPGAVLTAAPDFVPETEPNVLLVFIPKVVSEKSVQQ